MSQFLDGRTLFYRYNTIEAVNLTYGRFLYGQCPGRGGISTVGSSTTVSAATASQEPFAPLAVGDVLAIYVGETLNIRTVTAKASNISITVNAAIDLSALAGGYTSWSFYAFRSGQTAADGWVDVSGYNPSALSVHIAVITQPTTPGVTYSIEGRFASGLDPTAFVIKTASLATAGGDSAIVNIADSTGAPYTLKALRVGLRATTDATGTDVVTVSLLGGR